MCSAPIASANLASVTATHSERGIARDTVSEGSDRLTPTRSGHFGMATGWAGEGAVNEQIEATVKDAVERARSQLPQGPAVTHCAECGEPIPEARRQALPGVRLCLLCQQAADADGGNFSGYNRRGSKDSQLR